MICLLELKEVVGASEQKWEICSVRGASGGISDILFNPRDYFTIQYFEAPAVVGASFIAVHKTDYTRTKDDVMPYTVVNQEPVCRS